MTQELLKPELKDPKDIIIHLKSKGAPPYYLIPDDYEYIWDWVENGYITEEQYHILDGEKNLKELVHKIFFTKDVKLPNNIIQAIKEAKAEGYSIQGMVIDWECANFFDFEFDYVVNEWLNENKSERENKLAKIYEYGVTHWKKL